MTFKQYKAKKQAAKDNEYGIYIFTGIALAVFIVAFVKWWYCL